MTRSWHTWAYCWLAVVNLSAPAMAQRRVAVIADTSGSMQTSDQPRYSLQVAKILSDLMSDQDKYAVLRMPTHGATFIGVPIPGQEDCRARADSSLMRELNPGDRPSFKSSLDRLLVFDDGTYFSADLHTAIPFLGSSGPRLLLVVTDAEVSDVGCISESEAEIARFQAGGAVTALINVGRGTGFQNSRAFTFQRSAPDSRNLIAAVAEIYQRFLGAQKLVQGNWQGSASAPVDPYVKEAYFIVAADGPVGELQGASGNPAAQIDYNYRGGGETTGVDGRLRSYRIARLLNPAAGTYTFHASAGNGNGGWILIQEYAIGVRSVAEGPAAPGSPVKVRFELFDERNGQAIIDTSSQPDLRLTVDLDGKTETLSSPVNGVFTTERVFSSAGSKPYTVRLQGRNIDRESTGQVQVISGGWRLTNLSPSEANLKDVVVLKVKVEPVGAHTPTPSKILLTLPDGSTLGLNDAGQEGDEQAGDGVYSVHWNANPEGAIPLVFHGESPEVISLRAEIQVKVRPVALAPLDFSWGPAHAITLQKLTFGQTGASALDLGGANVSAPTDVEVRTDFKKKNVVLEIQTSQGWLAVSDEPIHLHMEPGSSLQYPIRLRVGDCPEACRAGEQHSITVTARRVDGQELSLTSPVKAEILPATWWWCWRRELIGTLLALLAAIMIYGFIEPFRFKRRLGIQMATEENVNEGRFYEFRSRRGSHIGWYRDSRVYLTEGFIISGKKRGAFVSFRARRGGVIVRPEGGRLMRQSLDGEWELVADEQIGRAGILYRSQSGALFFEIRNK